MQHGWHGINPTRTSRKRKGWRVGGLESWQVGSWMVKEDIYECVQLLGLLSVPNGPVEVLNSAFVMRNLSCLYRYSSLDG